jgi:hypothetical protein
LIDTSSSAKNQRVERVSPFLKRSLHGSIIGNLAGLVLFGFSAAMTAVSNGESFVRLLGIPSLLLAPFAVGFVESRYWGENTIRFRAMLLHSLICTCLAFSVAAIAFHEGIVCLLILAPIFYIAVLTGAFFGWYFLKSETAAQTPFWFRLCF